MGTSFFWYIGRTVPSIRIDQNSEDDLFVRGYNVWYTWSRENGLGWGSPRVDEKDDQEAERVKIYMNYFFCPAGNYEDFASGRVIYGAKGIPNFPVRLIAEIFGRALKASGKKDRLYVYDCWKRIEKQNIGKRRFEILSKNTCYRLEKTTWIMFLKIRIPKIRR